MKYVLTALACFIGTALGLSAWLGFFKDSHYYTREISQESRRAEWVGQKADAPPATPITFTIRNHGCLRVDRARIDGDTLDFEITRICGGDNAYAELRWKAKAGDFVIEQGLENWQVYGLAMGEHEVFEINNSYTFHADPRITEIVVSTNND